MLHQSTQRRLCRSLFLLACVLPTLVLAFWAVWRVQPGYHQLQLAWLSEALGVRVECDTVETPRPGLSLYHGVRLLDRETREPLAGLDLLRIDSQRHPRAISGGRLSLGSRHAPRLAEAIALALRAGEPHALEIPLQHVTLDDLTWQEVVLELDSGHTPGRSLALRQPSRTGVALHVTRNRQIDPPQTRLTIETGAATLPWRVLAELTPLPSDLGATAAVEGRLTLTHETGVGSLEGRFTGVDLVRLSPGDEGLSIAAPADFPAAAFHWQRGRFTEIDVHVETGAGHAALWFADAVRYYLCCTPVGSLRDAIADARTGKLPSDAPIKFDELAFRLQVDAEGLRLSGLPGRRRQAMASALVMRGGEQLLFEPRPGPPTPVESLLQVVKSPSIQAPQFCPRARKLSERLPISTDANKLR